jgi:hypothetical protein
MLMTGYFDSVGKWCEEHGVKFSGHLMGEDTLNSQIKWTGSCMPCYEYMGIVGIDHLTASLTWPSGLPFYMTPKQAASSAHQLGNRVATAGNPLNRELRVHARRAIRLVAGKVDFPDLGGQRRLPLLPGAGRSAPGCVVPTG